MMQCCRSVIFQTQTYKEIHRRLVRFVLSQSGAWGWGEGWGTGQRQWKVPQTSRYKVIAGMRCTPGLPWWPSGRRLQLQCRRHRFDPWVGKTRWRRRWQPTPVFLPRKSQAQKSLAGYSPWGPKRTRHGLATKRPQQYNTQHDKYN